MKQAQKISSFFSLKDVLGYLCDEKQINAYEYKGYARCIDSLEHYYKYSLEMLDIRYFVTLYLRVKLANLHKYERHTTSKIFRHNADVKKIVRSKWCSNRWNSRK